MGSLTTLSPDGRCLAVAHDLVVGLSERGTGQIPAAVLELPDPAAGIALTHDRIFVVTRAGLLVMADRRGRLELRRRLKGRGVGVGCYGDHVVAFTDKGWLRWRIDDARPGTRWGKERTTSAREVCAGACAGDGRVAVITEAGELWLVDARDRRRRVVGVRGETVIPGGPSGWFVARDEEVLQVTPGGRVRPVVRSDAAIRQVAASPTGRILAVTLTDSLVALWSVSERRPVSRVQVFDRRVTGIDFGPDGVLGVGLDLGDGNWFDLRTEQVVRNQPPVGGVRRTWGVALTTDVDAPLGGEGAGIDDHPTVEVSRVMRGLVPEPRLPPAVLGLVALGMAGLVAGFVMGQAVLTP